MKFIDIYNKIQKFLTGEKAFFCCVVIILIILSYLTHDNKIALISAVFGIGYTIFNGKSNIFCYFFGIVSTLLYSYLSFRNRLFGNFSLNIFYYLPVQIIGLINWKKHLITPLTVKKTKLKTSQKKIYYSITLTITTILIISIIILKLSFLNFLDGLTLILSIIAMILAVKRCFEQWYYWISVNFLSMIMWILAYFNGSNCLLTIIMWGIYLILGVYFFKKWQKENL